jgi:peptidoglycan/LPS O-acetylase OafA/YrhL
VVVFHYHLANVPGGFTGVDVFFVISGFLITSLLLRDLVQERWSLVRFYERRVRRIFPALFLMLAVVSVAAAWVLLPMDLASYGKSLIATTTFTSNLYFWKEAGYFARASEFKPLLHTWSLGVEEQFYLVWPPLLYLAFRFARRRLRMFLPVAAVASFAASVWLSYRHPDASFFWPIARAWELALGALLAAGSLPVPANAVVRHCLSVAGIACICLGYLVITPAVAFPGWVALAPCLGAASVIYAGIGGAGAGNRWLAARPLVALGLISYALYLWHWPMLVLAQNLVLVRLTMVQTCMVLAAAIAASTISLWLVERPFRAVPGVFSQRRVWQLAAIATAICLALGLILWRSDGLPGRFTAGFAGTADSSVPDSIRPDCFTHTPEDVNAGRLCSIGAATGPASYLLWGDSHAFNFASALAPMSAELGTRGELATRGSCPPLLEVSWPQPGCAAFNQAVMQLIDRSADIHRVIISALWASYAEGSLYQAGAGFRAVTPLAANGALRVSVEANGSAFRHALLDTVRHVTSEGKQVVLIGPVPEIGLPVPETVLRARRAGVAPDFGPSREQFEQRQRAVLDTLAEAAHIPGVMVILPHEILCAARCMIAAGDQPLYFDDNHLSKRGLQLLEPLLRPVVGP